MKKYHKDIAKLLPFLGKNYVTLFYFFFVLNPPITYPLAFDRCQQKLQIARIIPYKLRQWQSLQYLIINNRSRHDPRYEACK